MSGYFVLKHIHLFGVFKILQCEEDNVIEKSLFAKKRTSRDKQK